MTVWISDKIVSGDRKGEAMKTINVGMLGLGTIGSGVYRLLEKNGAMMAAREGIQLNLSKILVRDLAKERPVQTTPNQLTTEPADILENPDIDVVAEFIGGEHPAREYILRALRAGKSVVTANKEVIAKHWLELEAAARENKVGLYFEASVAGGIPIIKSIRRSLQANRMMKVMGIINGTTNYILTRMSDEGKDFDEVLKEAIQLGYAEPDPTNDIEGHDVRYKIAILSAICFRHQVKEEAIHCEGITNITAEDIEFGRQLGFTIKLLAIAKLEDNKLEVRVHPTFIPKHHPLASVRDAYNAIFLEGDAVGRLMFYGRGAGDMPTASALVSDILTAAQSNGNHHRTQLDETDGITIQPDWLAAYYIRLTVKDTPGVLAEIAGIFGRHQVSIESVIQKGRGDETAPLIFVSHDASELSMMQAMQEIRQSPAVLAVNNLIRVER